MRVVPGSPRCAGSPVTPASSRSWSDRRLIRFIRQVTDRLARADRRCQRGSGADREREPSVRHHRSTHACRGLAFRSRCADAAARYREFILWPWHFLLVIANNFCLQCVKVKKNRIHSQRNAPAPTAGSASGRHLTKGRTQGGLRESDTHRQGVGGRASVANGQGQLE